MKLRIINPAKIYKKTSASKDLFNLFQSQQYIIDNIVNQGMSFEELAKNSEKKLGYFLTPEFIGSFIQEHLKNYDSYNKILSQIPKTSKGKFKYTQINTKLLQYVRKDNPIFELKMKQFKTFHVIISWKYNPLLRYDFINFLQKLREDNKEFNYTKVVFYLADSFFKDVPRIEVDDLQIIETLLHKIHDTMPTLSKIAHRNKNFVSNYKKIKALTEDISSYCQKTTLPGIIDDLETMSNYITKDSFLAFLKSKHISPDLKFVLVDDNQKIKRVLTNPPENIIYLNCDRSNYYAPPPKISLLPLLPLLEVPVQKPRILISTPLMPCLPSLNETKPLLYLPLPDLNITNNNANND